MLTRLVIGNCRSLLDLRLEPGRLTLIIGPNGSGKPNLYRGQRLLTKTSLHPDLLPALARLIQAASQNTQVWVVSHANRLLHELRENPACPRRPG